MHSKRILTVGVVSLLAGATSSLGLETTDEIMVLLRPAPAGSSAETGHRLADGSTIINAVTTVDPTSGRFRAELIPGPTGNGDDVEEVYITTKDENGKVIRSNCYITFPPEPVNPDSEMIPVFDITSGPTGSTFLIPQINVVALLEHGAPTFTVGQRVSVRSGVISEWADVIIGDGAGFAGTQDILSAASLPSFTGELEVVGFDELSLAVLLLGDMDGNGVFDAFDVSPFELALADKQAYIDTHLGLDPDRIGDFDGSGSLDAFDVPSFETSLAAIGANTTIPEACTLGLLAFAAGLLVRRRR